MRGLCASNNVALLLFTVLCLSIPKYVAAGDVYISKRDAGIFDPSSKSVTINYELLTAAESVEVQINSFEGQVIKRLYFTDLLAGKNSFEWDGTDSNDERVEDGRYQLILYIDFVSGTRETEAVDVRVATFDQPQDVQAPDPLPPEELPYTISGSLSTFGRSQSDSSEIIGETRFRTSITYDKDNLYARGTFSAIQNHDGSDPTFNGTQARIEQRWEGGKIRGVYRDSLGSFNDPMQLFSDFKTERDKYGLTTDHSVGDFSVYALVFDTDNSVDSQEQGSATRLTYGSKRDWLIGTSYTIRRAVYDLSSGVDTTKETEQAFAADIQIPIFDSFKILGEVTRTEDEQSNSDFGYLIKGEYDFRQLRMSVGYIDLGEDFSAPFSNPLHGIESDGAGLEASIDYFTTKSIWYFDNLSTSFRFFSLRKHSDDEELTELDGSLRFKLGQDDSFFFSALFREDETSDTFSSTANYIHNWNSLWSSRLVASYSDSDTTDTFRSSVNTRYQNEDNVAQLELEWLERDTETSSTATHQEVNLRMDLSNELWALQLQSRYSDEGDDEGVNFFGRVDYKPVYLHRYNIVAYCSVGDRAALDFEEQVEFGLEVQF